MTTNTIFTADENVVINAPVAEVMPDINNPRRRKPSTEAIAEKAESILSRGLLNPIRIYPDGVIEDGECRYHAVRRLGAEGIRAIVVPRPESEATTVENQLVANLSRDDMAPIDIADAFRRLRDDLGRTPGEIASEVGWARGRVERYLSAADLPEEGRKAFDSGRIGLECAEYVVRNFKPAHREEAVARAKAKPNFAAQKAALEVYARDIVPAPDRYDVGDKPAPEEVKKAKKAHDNALKLVRGFSQTYGNGKGRLFISANKGRIEQMDELAETFKSLGLHLEAKLRDYRAQVEVSRGEHKAPIENLDTEAPEAVETSEVKPVPKKKPAAAKKAA